MGKKDEIDKAEKKRKADFILEYANKDISDIKVPENPHPFRDGFDFDGRFRLPGAVKHLRKILDFEKESVEDSLDFFLKFIGSQDVFRIIPRYHSSQGDPQKFRPPQIGS